MHRFTPPASTERIKVVQSFAELVATPFAGSINALCWPRTLAGDFSEVVEKLGDGQGIEPLDETRLNALVLSAAGRAARDILLADLQLLRAHGLTPNSTASTATRATRRPRPYRPTYIPSTLTAPRLKPTLGFAPTTVRLPRACATRTPGGASTSRRPAPNF